MVIFHCPCPEQLHHRADTKINNAVADEADMIVCVCVPVRACRGLPQLVQSSLQVCVCHYRALVVDHVTCVRCKCLCIQFTHAVNT